jgi:hypothetical protein
VAISQASRCQRLDHHTDESADGTGEEHEPVCAGVQVGGVLSEQHKGAHHEPFDKRQPGQDEPEAAQHLVVPEIVEARQEFRAHRG